MCGYIGTFSFNTIDNKKLSDCNKSIICRGPDSLKSVEGVDYNLNYSFIFNRLSILDLSENANQPMVSESGNEVLMFNGEIYNNNELRDALVSKGAKFKTSHSDTEVILNGLMLEGIEYLQKLRGQFAITYLDKVNKSIYLAKDRLGQKPLYYRKTKSSLEFSSNLTSLIKLNTSYEVDNKQLINYLNFGVVRSPNTLFMGYKKLLPGSYIKINYSRDKFEESTNIYWKTEDHINNKKFQSDEFFSILYDSINLRMIADVKVANFLSGGIDSSTIVKILHDKGEEINTFSVDIENKKYDESKWSKQVSDKYLTNHNSIKISSSIEFTDIEEALDALDEPYSDPSLIPSFILSKYISRNFKVAISGDGGDELLGGYRRTAHALESKNKIKNSISKLYPMYPSFLGTGSYFLSKSNNYAESYRSFIEDQKLLQLLGTDSTAEQLLINESRKSDEYKSLIEADYKFYLPEMMMFKIDRTSMANSLEIRSPFVDHKLVEYVLSHDTAYYNQSKPKKILKDFLIEDFGEGFVNREKKGFVFDLENWIFRNYELIKENLDSGILSNHIDLNKLKYLKVYKSRINAHRIWKLFVLERFLQKLNLN